MIRASHIIALAMVSSGLGCNDVPDDVDLTGRLPALVDSLDAAGSTHADRPRLECRRRLRRVLEQALGDFRRAAREYLERFERRCARLEPQVAKELMTRARETLGARELDLLSTVHRLEREEIWLARYGPDLPSFRWQEPDLEEGEDLETYIARRIEAARALFAELEE